VLQFVSAIAILAATAVQSAPYLGAAHEYQHHEAPYGQQEVGYAKKYDEYNAYPKYSFEYGYGVKDPHTGDHKTQWEVRDGDVVKGQYTLHEADGTERVVDYKSDGHNGFEADVKKVGHANHPQQYASHPAPAPQHYGHGHGSGASYVNVDKHY
uniref:Uncharacterized protein n=1 Tax=Anopheles atroparvus TaxID=41427 RepID=A0AAG5D7S2_ANOAO